MPMSSNTKMLIMLTFAAVLAAVYFDIPQKLGLTQPPWDQAGKWCPPGGRAGFGCTHEDMQRGRGGYGYDPRAAPSRGEGYGGGDDWANRPHYRRSDGYEVYEYGRR